MPPRGLTNVDFVYFGGLYRSVRLRVCEPLHITDPIQAKKMAGGGVFVTYTGVSADRATVNVATHVVNESSQAATFHILSTLVDADGKAVLQLTGGDVRLDAHADTTISQSGTVANPRLWSPDTPYLYRLDSKVESGGVTRDSLLTPIGIRTFAFSPTGGFSINGKPLVLNGSNRHQEYPYVGYALSEAATRRDVVLIKKAGLNMIRTCHYPVQPAFLEACDELGVLVMEPIPGWQHFEDAEPFKANAYDAVREMIRRDRNHPSIILWEASLNETSMPTEFKAETERIAHEEYPGDQCYTYCDYGHPPYDVIQGGSSGPRYVRENGDWAYGGNQSTSRQGRGAGEGSLLLQAWNFAYDRNADLKDKGVSGAAYWGFFDYNRGYHDNIERSGAMDLYRLPKFAFYWSQSQRDPVATANGLGGPMVFLANYWTARPSPAKVVCFSNCEQVELFVNGKSVGRHSPDAGPDVFYNDLNKPGYGGRDGKGGFPWNGGCQTHLAHPAFTFTDIAYQAGELKAVGYLKGAVAAQHTVHTPGSPAKVAVSYDLQGIPATSNDVVLVCASILDQNNVPVSTDSSLVTFRLASGPGELIGTNPVQAEAGIATVLLRTNGTRGTIAVSAVAAGISGGGSGTITTRDP